MSDLEDRLRSEHKEQEYATTWRPDAGDILTGTFVRMDSGETKYGECEIAHVRDEAGELMAVWLFHKVLLTEWDEADPEPGDEVGICYHGQRDGSGYSYHNYTVEVECTDETSEDRSPKSGAAERDSALDGQEQAERLYADEEAEDRPGSTIDDPNSELPY